MRPSLPPLPSPSRKPEGAFRCLLLADVLHRMDADGRVPYARRDVQEFFNRAGGLACDPQDDRLLSDAEVEDLLAFGGPVRGRQLTELDLRLVARLYADAYQEGASVQRHVADRLGVSIPTAARRIMLARDRGLISGRFSQTRGARRTQRGRVHSDVE